MANRKQFVPEVAGGNEPGAVAVLDEAVAESVEQDHRPPKVGEFVQYTLSAGSSPQRAGKKRPALITEVNEDDGSVNLVVFIGSPQDFQPNAPGAEPPKVGRFLVTSAFFGRVPFDAAGAEHTWSRP